MHFNSRFISEEEMCMQYPQTKSAHWHSSNQWPTAHQLIVTLKSDEILHHTFTIFSVQHYTQWYLKTTKGTIKQKIPEVFMIVAAYAIPNPGTVVVHPHHTSLADWAVMGSWEFYLFTFITIRIISKITRQVKVIFSLNISVYLYLKCFLSVLK